MILRLGNIFKTFTFLLMFEMLKTYLGIQVKQYRNN